jgi:hypothetical protein
MEVERKPLLTDESILFWKVLKLSMISIFDGGLVFTFIFVKDFFRYDVFLLQTDYGASFYNELTLLRSF